MKRQSNPKLKGTVLFTVIAVMSLLIIFLTSTLVLAASASNRAHKNYSSSQTEYTARAAIESFAEALTRNKAIAKTIVDMPKGSVITPDVEINDTSLGRIGYYKADGSWVPNKLQVEYVDDTYVYNLDTSKWEQQQVLKVTATVSLANEENTVSLYLRKKAPNEPKTLAIKGIQTAGGTNMTSTQGTITGALAVGLISVNNPPYVNPSWDNCTQIYNGTILKTDLTFINDSVHIAGNAELWVTEPDTGTVIMGNTKIENSNFVKIDYSSSGTQLVQKTIPYLYVDGEVTTSSSLNIKNVGLENAPYNIFCGSWDTFWNQVNIDADLYCMDSSKWSKLGGTGTTTLSAWSSSWVQGTDTQFNSTGGNIYSKGSLELSHTTINGDIRVEGDLILGEFVTVNGDVVVGGTLYVPVTQNRPSIAGTVYADNCVGYGSGPVLKAGYTQVDNIIKTEYKIKDEFSSDYVKVVNEPRAFYKHTATVELSPGVYEGVYGEQIPVNVAYYNLATGNNYFDPARTYYTPDEMMYYNFDYNAEADEYYYYFECDDTGAKIIADPSLPEDNDARYQVTYDSFYVMQKGIIHTGKIPPHMYYMVGEDATILTIANMDGTDSGVETTETVSYYDSAGNRVDASEALDVSGVVKPVADYSGEIYPSTMTREAITGQTADGTYQIITTLDEVREAIGYSVDPADPSKGEFEDTVYYKNVPTDIANTLNLNDGNPSNNVGPIKDVHGYIVNDCVLTEDDVKGQLVKIKPVGTKWIVLDNINLGADGAFNIVVDDSHGTVNFFIRNSFTLENSNILTENIYNQWKTGADIVINETDEMNINFYGEEGSSFNFNNNCTICGIAKAPYTKFNMPATGGGVSPVIYNGVAVSNPHWIGNVLFKEVTGGNNFTLLHTNSNASGDGDDTASEVGDYMILYYDVY